MIYALLITLIGIVLIVNALFMESSDSIFLFYEGVIGMAVIFFSLLAVAYLCGIDYANAHQEPQEKQAIESEVSDD